MINRCIAASFQYSLSLSLFLSIASTVKSSAGIERGARIPDIGRISLDSQHGQSVSAEMRAINVDSDASAFPAPRSRAHPTLYAKRMRNAPSGVGEAHNRVWRRDSMIRARLAGAACKSALAPPSGGNRRKKGRRSAALINGRSMGAGHYFPGRGTRDGEKGREKGRE